MSPWLHPCRPRASSTPMWNGKAAGKAQWLSHFKGGTWEQNEISDIQVMVYGNTRMATGAWTGKGVESDGRPG